MSIEIESVHIEGLSCGTPATWGCVICQLPGATGLWIKWVCSEHHIMHRQWDPARWYKWFPRDHSKSIM